MYINENLTSFRSTLYKRVRNECAKQWEHWTYDGNIYVQKHGARKVHTILDRDDFFRVFGKEINY